METYRGTGEGPRKTKEKTEIMVTQRNAKDCWQPPEARRGKEIFSRWVRGNRVDTVISDT